MSTTPDHQPQFDLVVRGGSVFDGVRFSPKPLDIGIVDGVIAAVAPSLEGTAARELDCSGRIVSPGLIDLHVHAFEGVTTIGLNPSDAAFTRGVVAVADAGSAGASTFPAFRSLIADRAPRQVYSFLNVSVLGLVDIRHGELLDPTALRIEDAVRVVEQNRDVIRGLKVRLSRNVVGDQPLDILARALELANAVALPLMVHIGNTACTLVEIVERLRAGDIVTHVYTGSERGLFDENGVIPAGIHEARQRGVLFEIGHGRTQIVYSVARRAIEQGFLPDVISSDISNGNWNGPSFDLATVASKLISLGMPLDDALASMTSRPAAILGLESDGFGGMRVGAPARITVLEQLDMLDPLPDSAGDTIEVARLEPTMSILGSDVHETVEWRGHGALVKQ